MPLDDPILLDLPDEICGERVLVRPYRFGDGRALFEAVEESRDHILLGCLTPEEWAARA